ncbi:MAG: hypothetical protein JRN52_05875 [Nitrososphaerota archaeon]|nr:hypothetical protein [Nitrososphaerota archaeon]
MIKNNHSGRLSGSEMQTITTAIEKHLNRQRVLKAVIRSVTVENSAKRAEGYVEIPCAVTRNKCLFDFEATLSQKGKVDRLVVNGSKMIMSRKHADSERDFC